MIILKICMLLTFLGFCFQAFSGASVFHVVFTYLCFAWTSFSYVQARDAIEIFEEF